MTNVIFKAFADEFVKIAQEVIEPALPHPGAILGAGLLGATAGYAGGHLAAHGMNALMKRRGGIPASVLQYGPPLAGLAGLGVGAHQMYVLDEAKRAAEARNNVGENP